MLVHLLEICFKRPLVCRFDITKKMFIAFISLDAYVFAYILMSRNMIILYFLFALFHVSVVALILSSATVLFFL